MTVAAVTERLSQISNEMQQHANPEKTLTMMDSRSTYGFSGTRTRANFADTRLAFVQEAELSNSQPL
jgi:hypothetical protein